jgi:Tat protein translocase TatC
MVDEKPASAAGPPPPPGDDVVEAARMSFGEHLEELRTRVIRGMLGLVAGTIISLVFAREVLEILYAPLLRVQYSHGLRPSLMAMDPAGPFLTYLKMGVLCGLILSLPWIAYQAWMFVASGLYKHEQRFVGLFGPVSAVLFTLGVMFMYFIVLPIVMNFFVGFNERFNMPELGESWFSALLSGEPDEATTQPAETAPPPEELPQAPLLAEDPPDPEPGMFWVNTTERRFNVQTADERWTVALEKATASGAVRSEIGLKFYVSFVLTLALAFGIAFEMPVAVVFLAMTGIVTTATMAKSRRYVILSVFAASSILTPPDVISQILLAIPMIALFEGGLIAARAIERRKAAEESGPAT